MNRVFVVLDKSYGAKIAHLAEEGLVWVIDTPANKAAARQIWQDKADKVQLHVTTFAASDEFSLEDIFIDEIETIDLHHGKLSAVPPYTELDVIGIPLSESIQRELAAYGLDQFVNTKEGFRATRPLAAAYR